MCLSRSGRARHGAACCTDGGGQRLPCCHTVGATGTWRKSRGEEKYFSIGAACKSKTVFGDCPASNFAKTSERASCKFQSAPNMHRRGEQEIYCSCSSHGVSRSSSSLSSHARGYALRGGGKAGWILSTREQPNTTR